MTSQDVKWDQLDEMIEKTAQTTSDFERLAEIEKRQKELNDEKDKLNKEASEIRVKYKQEYTSKLKETLDGYGVLTVVDSRDHYEGRILNVTEDIIRFRYTYHYGSYTDTYEISTQELREKGYVKIERNGNSPIYVVDKITDPLGVYEIIKFRLRVELSGLINDLEYRKKSLKEYEQKIKETEKELDQFRKVSDSKITRVFNDISFGVTDLKIEDILKELPREIKMYDK